MLSIYKETRNFYGVTGNKQFWAKDPVDLDWFFCRGYVVQAARVGDYDVFHCDGAFAATLFSSKDEAVDFINR